MDKDKKFFYLIKAMFERGEYYFECMTEKEAEELKIKSLDRLSVEKRNG